MRLQRIEIKNWKCFTDKVLDFESGLNILHWANGTGKTSLIEAILFVLFDKRPLGLDFDSLRNNVNEDGKVTLYFTHEGINYRAERGFGKTTLYRVYKENELIARSRNEHKAVLDKIIPYDIMNGLWGHTSLAQSPILKTDFLFELLEREFEEALKVKQLAVSERTFYQRQKSSLEAKIETESVDTQDLDNIDKRIEELDKHIQSRAYISDKDYLHAKHCEETFPQYEKELKALKKMSYTYSKEDCIRLMSITNAHTQEEWDSYFANIEEQIKQEKAKASKVHPLAKYPFQIINNIIKESKKENKCLFCGGEYHPVQINYEAIDNRKIEQLERQLEDKKYSFTELVNSARYHKQHQIVSQLSFVNKTDWKKIIREYDEETNNLITECQELRKRSSFLKEELRKIAELLNVKNKHDEMKECVRIAEEYISEVKAKYANSITMKASSILSQLNSRYNDIQVRDGVYMVNVWDEDFVENSLLAVPSLSNGEKTIVAISLILAVRDLFIPDCFFIMDEAFANLDVSNNSALAMLLKKDTSQWIIVSHMNDFLGNS